MLRGHYDLIHDIHWSADDNYLVTASADGSAKVYDLTTKEYEYADRLNYTENDVRYSITQLLHPSFVYAAKFVPDSRFNSDDPYTPLTIATACFDKHIRIWQVSTKEIVLKDGMMQMLCLDLNIMEKPLTTIGAKSSIYEVD